MLIPSAGEEYEEDYLLSQSAMIENPSDYTMVGGKKKKKKKKKKKSRGDRSVVIESTSHMRPPRPKPDPSAPPLDTIQE